MDMSERTFSKKNIAAVALVAFVTVVLIRQFVFEAFFVRGDSMVPTLTSGEFVFVNKLAYLHNDPKRDDIIVVIPRVYPGRVVKRVIGLPGEWLSIENGIVSVRASRTEKSVNLDEGYLNSSDTPAIGKSRTNIDPNEYYVLGDNRLVSIDSRELGMVDRGSIKGRVFGAFNFKTLKYKGF
ncbi:MAG TPA: signal peptidase I [Candidatus Paceibacterota bacterium]|jgi:signal peptidase I, bacterial type